eukprot:UN28385
MGKENNATIVKDEVVLLDKPANLKKVSSEPIILGVKMNNTKQNHNGRPHYLEQLSKRGLNVYIKDVGSISRNDCGINIYNTCLGRSLCSAEGFKTTEQVFDQKSLNFLQIIGSSPDKVAMLIDKGILGS